MAASKACRRCGVDRPLGDFHALKRSPDGRRGTCKSCASEMRRARNAANPEKYLRARRCYSLRKKYGITADEADAMLAAQDGGCAVCGSPDPKSAYGAFHVDHDHATGRVRGLLCTYCNTRLAVVEDRHLVASMEAYLGLA